MPIASGDYKSSDHQSLKVIWFGWQVWPISEWQDISLSAAGPRAASAELNSDKCECYIRPLPGSPTGHPETVPCFSASIYENPALPGNMVQTLNRYHLTC